MCILSYLPPNVHHNVAALRIGGINNPDGHGWAITDRDTIIVGKSMDLETALDDFTTARSKHMRGHALFHSRWATHGKLDTSNVHPFVVGGSELTVVAHNGVLPYSSHPTKGDPRSDTRLFADEILPTQYKRLDKPGARRALTQWIGKANKLVILTVDPKYREHAYIINEKQGNWNGGVWHSNFDYERVYGVDKTWGKVTTVGKHWWDDYGPADDDDTCLICNYGRVNAAMFCTECGSCQDCFEPSGTCQCYQRIGWVDAYRSDAETEAEDARWLEERLEQERVERLALLKSMQWSEHDEAEFRQEAEQ